MSRPNGDIPAVPVWSARETPVIDLAAGDGRFAETLVLLILLVFACGVFVGTVMARRGNP